MAISRTEDPSSEDADLDVVDEAGTVVRTTLGLVMVDWARTDEDPEDFDEINTEDEWDGIAVRVVALCAPVLDVPKPGMFPEAVGRTVELDGTSVAVTGQTVVERATTTVVTSPTVQSDLAVGQAVIVEEWVVKIVLVVMGTDVEFCCSSEVLTIPEPEAESEGVTATAAVSDVAVVKTGTGFVSAGGGGGGAELSEASEAVTGQIVVPTTTTTVVSPASLTDVEVPVT